MKTNFDTLGNPGLDKRLAGRITGTFSFPDIGLGPLIRASTDAVGVRDLERDFYLTKGAFDPERVLPPVPAAPVLVLTGRRDRQRGALPEREPERVHPVGGGNPELSALLRVPQGTSWAAAQRVGVTWDRRDNAFNAHSGTLFTSGIEHIDWYSNLVAVVRRRPERVQRDGGARVPVHRHVRRVHSSRQDGPPRGGDSRRVQRADSGDSSTYPDRLFYMGGADSMRGWLQDTFVPQEYADQLQPRQPDAVSVSAQRPLPERMPTAVPIGDVGCAAATSWSNPRLELRFPFRSRSSRCIFGDAGNLWLDPLDPFRNPATSRPPSCCARTWGSGCGCRRPVGPLVFDYGSSVNVTRKSYEDLGAFHFAIGLF